MPRFRIQTHGRIQEWVADEKGYFNDEGLEYEFVHNTLMNDIVAGAASGGAEHRSGAFETMAAGNECAIGSACHWAVNMAATSRHGKMWGHAYSVTPAGIFVPGDSPVVGAADLAGIPVAVGYHSGSHFSAVESLENVLGSEDIVITYRGGPRDRLEGMLSGELQAANMFGYSMYVLEQKGFRKVLDTTFMIGFIVEDDVSPNDLAKYFRALRRAQRDIDAEPSRYKHFFLKELPVEFHDQVDVNGFGPGERIVFEPYTREVYDSTQTWMEERNLFDGEHASVSYDDAILV
ncbi:MAG: hypothetical protein WBM90_04750 [Acidimicrobiia bacterium]